MTIGANQTVANVLNVCPDAPRILLKRGMQCIGCSIAPFETLAEACAIYDVPLDALLAELNASAARPTVQGGERRS
jgi:hybrid cluster-associated redox disulfide protein